MFCMNAQLLWLRCEWRALVKRCSRAWWIFCCADHLNRRGGLRWTEAKTLAADLYKDFGEDTDPVDCANGEMSYWSE